MTPAPFSPPFPSSLQSQHLPIVQGKLIKKNFKNYNEENTLI